MHYHQRLEYILYIQQKREDFSLVLGHAWLVKGGVHNRSFVVAFYSLIKTLSEQLEGKNKVYFSYVTITDLFRS